jgi:hypothetical protein
MAWLRAALDFDASRLAIRRADTANPVLYAFKRLTGLVVGTVKLYPYYYKVREYNDHESRDL